jgi:hypothetical protein
MASRVSPLAPADSDSHDAWTIAAIAVVAYCLANMLHEGLGHGGACMLLGCKPQVLNAIFFGHDETTTTAAGERWIAAGGGIVNLMAAFIALVVLRAGRPAAASGRYFVWLFAAVNLLMAFGYLLFSGIGGIGDWKRVVEGLEPHAAYRVGLAATGGLLYFVVAPKLLAPHFAGFLRPDSPAGPQIWQLVRMPYLIGGCAFVLAGLLNPYGLKLVLISAAAASFGGTSLLIWYPFDKVVPQQRGIVPFAIRRSRAWVAAGAVALLVFVGGLGPGLNF